MRKKDELSNPQSCLNRAGDNEMVFVLLARDAAAPTTIRKWVEERLRLGENHQDDDQIEDALACAVTMEKQRAKRLEAPCGSLE